MLIKIKKFKNFKNGNGRKQCLLFSNHTACECHVSVYHVWRLSPLNFIRHAAALTPTPIKKQSPLQWNDSLKKNTKIGSMYSLFNYFPGLLHIYQSIAKHFFRVYVYFWSEERQSLISWCNLKVKHCKITFFSLNHINCLLIFNFSLPLKMFWPWLWVWYYNSTLL